MRNKMRPFLVLALILLAFLKPISLFAQLTSAYPIQLQWNGVGEVRYANDTVLYIGLESAEYEGVMPVYCSSFPIYDDAVKVQVKLSDVKTNPLSMEEMQVAKKFSYSTDFELNALTLRSRDESLLSVRIVPFRQVGGTMEKLLSATLSVTLTPDFSAQKANPTYVDRSAMANGEWYKIGLSKTGIYKLTYSDLSDLGINVSSIDPRQIRIYHNGGGVLPEMNAFSRPDDLVEVPVFVSGEADGKFDNGDYILFYGRGPVCWKLDSEKQAYIHEQNPYDDYSYAFVVTGLGAGKRISEAEVPSGVSEVTVNQFLDYQVYENDDYNLNGTGRTYFGDRMDLTSTKNINFDFPNVITTKNCWVKTALAGRNFNPASFEVSIDNVKKATYSIETTTSSTTDAYAYEVGGWVSAVPTSETVHVELKHNSLGSSSTSEGYVDYVLANAWRSLKMVGGQMSFRNPDVINNKVCEYRLSNASQQIQVWNVSNAVNPVRMKGQLNGTVFNFKAIGNVENEFIAFNGSSYCTAKVLGEVDNQNLHGIRDVDFVILTYSDFMSQAERLKALHNRLDSDLNIYITTPELIYNEFSCGAKDITAIRDFCRMLYLDSSPGRKIKYLLLLGDCSYDYKNRNGIVDFVPSYETVSSLDMLKTFVTDDYFGFMDATEGNIGSSLADIGIGRFPVQTLEQATQMVDKIERYVVKDETTMRPWRNKVTFFTDDEADFVRSAERLSAKFNEVGGEATVVDKIYLDAYPQVSAPGGEIAPEVNAAINSCIEKGTLVLHYIGHGGEVQLSEEKIMQRKDVDSWRNAPMYPLMITGTCEFSRYDDHKRTSLGEYSFLNQYGGMIAMFTTSRVTFGGPNETFASRVYNNLFRISGEELYRLGDVYRMGKTTGFEGEKRYVFFGDPALRLAYPKWKVETLSINGHYPGFDLDSIQINDTTWQTYPIYHDTIGALQPVEIEGVVKDLEGNVATNFNGVVSVIVYDKEAELSTMGTTLAGVINFKLRNSMIFNGKTEAVNGRFKISFIVPRDISYRFGQGLINYYATDYENEANGNCDSFIIGGFYDEAFEDNDPPEIRLFIDDTLFVSGGLTGESPILLAYIEDESGINTTGAGIGHDIMATLTGSSRSAYCLNDYFVAEIDQPGKGTISYKMQNLPDGDYTLTLKVWDIYNNSGTATIDFTVVNSSGMHIENAFNSPNPMTDETCFVFDHNQVGNNMKVDIYIYDIMGRWVNTLSEVVSGTSTRITPIRWNGRNANGECLRNGLYVYRIVATNDQGETATLVSKLVLSK